jgi:hypothetical protein
MTEKKNKKSTSPTIITLTLPEQDEETRSGTLVIARGDLAHIGQFTYTSLSDLTAVIKSGFVALASVEANPPKEVSASSSPAKGSAKSEVKPKDEEPTVDIPLKQGKVAVKISHLKIVGGESDAVAYRQAVLIAGRLIDGKLWEGKSPIRIDDVYAVAGKLKHLTDRDLSMFELTDFVQIGSTNGDSDTPAETDDQLASDNSTAVTEAQPLAANGASDQTNLL